MIETFLTSTILSSVVSSFFRLWSQSQQDKRDILIASYERDRAEMADRRSARENIPDGWSKKYIATLAATTWAFTIIFPMVMQAFGTDVTLSFSWYEWKSGFLFFSDGKDVLKTISITGGHWTDLDSAILGSIVGSLFGGSIAKRR